MPLQLQFTAQSTLPVEVPELLPSTVRGKSLGEVERLDVQHGNQRLPLAELFKVSGSTGDDRIELMGNLAGVHGIGAKLDTGIIRVQGSAGRHLGSEMTGGEIHIHGNAGDWLGAEMHGGSVHVRGNAGNYAGSAYRGSRRGMTGGTLLVAGSVGDEVGHTLRRGLIAVGGACGDFVGLNVIAGTILVLGDCGQRPAAGMRRGTVGLFGERTPELLPTFRRGCRAPLLILELLWRQLSVLGFDVPPGLPGAACWTYHGDLLAGGRGELLTRG